MTSKTNSDSILEALEQKFDAINQKTETHLEGLLWSKPITYWDYIQTDVLLNLQTQRTVLPDEMVVIMYHQVNDVLFKMILWEINQLCHTEKPETVFFTEKLRRISRYFNMLTTSFDIMGDGMEVEQYMKFRNTLTPASGFQRPGAALKWATSFSSARNIPNPWAVKCRAPTARRWRCSLVPMASAYHGWWAASLKPPMMRPELSGRRPLLPSMWA